MRISDWSSDVCSSDLLLTGPGWIFMGGFMILIGSCLAVIALGYAFSETDVANTTMLYYLVFSGLSHTPAVAVVLTGLFVANCQIKINVTNASAGSIASSNVLSPWTNRHSARAVG